jgi:hypothetical protein
MKEESYGKIKKAREYSLVFAAMNVCCDKQPEVCSSSLECKGLRLF